ncbi:MAG: inositol monophosphatase family protein [Gammaproteobacteria bacterium]|jgi:myo-inositol-1(or 4)-monophosphatase|nr:inositol monophosphatase family protein [Gammaproteobacteria bacterium]
MNSTFEFTLDLVRRAGDMIAELRRHEPLERDYKGGIEIVTQADIAADALIAREILAAYPGHRILSEESSPDLGRVQDIEGPLWIVDPIDGTVNFAHGLNQSAVSIAFVDNGQIQHGVVYNPFSEELFAAKRGEGATLNGARIAVADETRLDRAIIATGFPYVKTGLEPMVKRLGAVLAQCADIRRLGSAALDICFVAAGRLDGYYESLSVWDYAAAQLIAKEAGAIYGHFGDVPEGEDPQFYSSDILVANATLYAPLRALLRAAS